MLIPVLLIGLAAGLILPTRAWWLVPIAAVGWPALFPPGSGSEPWIAQLLAGVLLGALNAAIGVGAGLVLRRSLGSRWR